MIQDYDEISRINLGSMHYSGLPTREIELLVIKAYKEYKNGDKKEFEITRSFLLFRHNIEITINGETIEWGLVQKKIKTSDSDVNAIYAPISRVCVLTEPHMEQIEQEESDRGER